MIHSAYYYPLLILFLGFLDFVNTLRFAAQIGFFASISEPRIGSTYMTLLVTLYNLGFAINSSLILYIANWLPKKYAYVIAVGLCLIFGIVWFVLSYRTIKRLEDLPVEEWYLIPEKSTDKTVTLNSIDHPDEETDKLTTSRRSSS
jgi:MFS family permease